MKRKNCIIGKLVLTVGLTFAMCTGAYAADWQNVWTQDYSAESDAEIPSESLSRAGGTFSAAIKDGALEMKSDSLIWWRAESIDTSRLNSGENANGITLQLRQWGSPFITSLDEPIEYDGVTYEFKGAGNNSVFVTEHSGKNALGQFTYINSDWLSDPSKGALRTNASRFIVDTSKFSSDENSLTVEIVYYTDDADGNSCTLFYPKKGGGDGSAVVYDSAALAADGAGEWRTARVELSDIDLTSKLAAEGGANSLRIETTPSKVNYFHSIAVYRTEPSLSADTQCNTFNKKLSDGDLYGNVRMTFDIAFPKDVRLIEGFEYNSGKNMVSAALADGEKNDFAELVFETGEEGRIYALTENGEQSLYTGDITGKTLTCVIETDMKGGTYTAEIYDGETLIGETAEPVGAVRKNGASGYYRAQYVRIKHNPKSKASFSRLGKCEVLMLEEEDFRKCSVDADALVLDVLSDGVVSGDFDLPQSGSKYSSTVEWSSSDSSAIRISADGRMAEVLRSEDEKYVTLTATVTYGGFSLEKTFDLTVKSLAGSFIGGGSVRISASGDGTVTARTTVENPGTVGAEKISFVVYAYNSTTGEMRFVGEDTKTSAELPIYGTKEFCVSGIAVSAGEELVCCLWDENNVPLANNAPTAVSGLKADNKATSVNLAWNPSYDDYNAVEYYEVYRDGVLISRCSDTEYRDKGASRLEKHEYEIVPVDTNGLKGGGGRGEGCTIEMPFWLEPIGKTEVAINSHGNGIGMAYKDDPVRDAYTEYAEVEGADGVKTVCRYVPDTKCIAFIATELEASDGIAVAIEITYLDTDGKLAFQYFKPLDGGKYALNTIDCGRMTGTREWKTLSIKPDKAMFGDESGARWDFSGADFGLRTSEGSGCYVKRVEMIEADLYE